MPHRSQAPASPGIGRRCSILAIAALCLGWAQDLRGAGREHSLPGHDLRINIDTRWAGCAHGGYYPIRIRATNVGPARDLTFRLVPHSNFLPEVLKAVRLEQNASVQFSLSVPMVGHDSSGTLRVEHDGRPLKDMEVGLSLVDADYGQFDRPSLLAISADPLSVDEFEAAVDFRHSAVGSSGYGYSRGSTRSTDHEVINPTMLPDRWIDYTGLDFVTIPLPTFEKLSADVRSAILGWARSGGNLVLYDLGEDPSQSERLARLTEINRIESGTNRWIKPDATRRNTIPKVTVDPYGGVMSETASIEMENGREVQELRWTGSQEHPFQMINVMQGTVVAFEGNPFPGSRHEWNWLLETLGPERFQWTTRHGFSARHGSSEFLNFLIPGISGVPVFAFLVLITFFSIAIGPINYYLLARRKRLHLLVITIPLIAVVTSASLFGYSMFAHGFGTKSRVRSVTVVDQRLQKSVTYARIGLYSGLAPSDGLQFDAETAVYPVWPDATDETFSGGRIDWTNAQHLSTGWLKSRTRTQFSTVAYEDQRERLQVNAAAGELEVSNGFPFPIKQLLVADSDGKLFYGESIAEGAAVKLPPATDEQLRRMSSWIAENASVIPPEFSGGNYRSRRRYDPYYGYNSGPLVQSSFQRSVMERSIPTLGNASGTPLVPGSYMGILAENPGVPVGLDGVSEVTGLHLLIGNY